MKKILAALLMSCLVLTGCTPNNHQPSPTKSQVPNAGSRPQTKKLDLDSTHFDATCEDTEVMPCVMMDEGDWFLVQSFDPLSREQLALCGTAGGFSIKYPCVWNGKQLSGQTDIIVYEVDED